MLVFVYGTLTDPDRAREVLDDFAFVGPATLEGCHRIEGTYPTLAPGGSVRGRFLDTPEIEALDAYEGVDSGLYVRVAVPFRGGDETVAVYVGDPDALSVSGVTWPGEGSFAERVRKHVREESVSVRTGTWDG